MKLGVHIGYWGLGLSSEDQLHIVQEAERLGYDSVWTAEAYGSDAATILGWLAGQTSSIRLGAAIFQMPARSAAMTAMTAATLDQPSDGRMLPGIGPLRPPEGRGGRAGGAGRGGASVRGGRGGQRAAPRLGGAIFQMPAGGGGMPAMTAATLDQLSDGRMLLGIGSSGPQVAEGWHGQRFARQLQRTREYVAVVRKALARERLEFQGETLELPLPDGPGKALKLMIAPVQERIPIYLAAIGPNNTRLAGEIADGWIPTLFSPEHVAEFRPLLEEGAARVSRSLDAFDIAPTVQAFWTDD